LYIKLSKETNTYGFSKDEKKLLKTKKVKKKEQKRARNSRVEGATSVRGPFRKLRSFNYKLVGPA
jgi:hypothetical protein